MLGDVVENERVDDMKRGSVVRRREVRANMMGNYTVGQDAEGAGWGTRRFAAKEVSRAFSDGLAPHKTSTQAKSEAL